MFIFVYMKKRLVITLLFLSLLIVVFGQEVHQDSIHDQNQQRKKVGVVLSGGGAKGFAHVGVLKVLEEIGIPIDYIAGTSMGAVVGGLYALGYTTDMIDSLIRSEEHTSELQSR